MIKGKIQRRGNRYIAIAPGNIRLDDNFCTSHEARIALNEFNSKLNNIKLNIKAESEKTEYNLDRKMEKIAKAVKAPKTKSVPKRKPKGKSK